MSDEIETDELTTLKKWNNELLTKLQDQQWQAKKLQQEKIDLEKRVEALQESHRDAHKKMIMLERQAHGHRGEVAHLTQELVIFQKALDEIREAKKVKEARKLADTTLSSYYARIDELNRRGSRHAQDAVLLYILENVELDDESHRLLQHYYLNHSDTLPVEMRDRIRKLVR